jgi:hypothetical protein
VKGKSVVSADDLEIECIVDLDEDMRIIDRTQTHETAEGDPPRLMGDKMDYNTISTMNEVTNKRRQIDAGGNNRGPPSKLALDTEDSLAGSSVSSMLSRTRLTMESELSQLTEQMRDMKEMMHTLMQTQMRQQS